jgi:hypothetical protein
VAHGCRCDRAESLLPLGSELGLFLLLNAAGEYPNPARWLDWRKCFGDIFVRQWVFREGLCRIPQGELCLQTTLQAKFEVRLERCIHRQHNVVGNTVAWAEHSRVVEQSVNEPRSEIHVGVQKRRAGTK